MRLLVLGGTAWLGREVAAAAVAAGDDVTCLARGEAGPVADGSRLVAADRTRPGAYDALAGSWDAVVDVARQPGQVRGAVAALADRTATYVLVSTGNVYADQRTPGQGEDAPLLPPLEDDVMASMEVYGQAKVACEQAVVGVLGRSRSLVARAGLIGGPGDPYDRGTWWPWRFEHPAADDGAVLVPDAPDQPVQLLDVRDLAAWLVAAARSGLAGTCNTTGETVRLADHLELARGVAGHTGPVVAADPAWLLARGVQEWMGERSLPLWLADPDWQAMGARDSSRARAAGLVRRPLEQTLADTLAWARTLPPRPWAAGLPDDLERDLLAALR